MIWRCVTSLSHPSSRAFLPIYVGHVLRFCFELTQPESSSAVAYRLPPPPSLLPLPPLLEMESAENNKAPGTTVSTPLPFSPTSSSNSGLPRSPPALVVLSPCAACKILRRRCADKCVLAPYFPPTEPLKFTIAHRVFGASNIIKLLQVYLHLSLSIYICISHTCGASFWVPLDLVWLCSIHS